jgi:hypothetical protein
MTGDAQSYWQIFDIARSETEPLACMLLLRRFLTKESNS